MAERMAERDRENVQRLADDKRRERERRDAIESQRHGRRREIIQSVKHQVLEQWFAPILGRPDLKARALQDIERELTALPVEELPRAELVLIAEGVRDCLYREALEAGQRSQERATRRQRHSGRSGRSPGRAVDRQFRTFKWSGFAVRVTGSRPNGKSKIRRRTKSGGDCPAGQRENASAERVFIKLTRDEVGGNVVRIAPDVEEHVFAPEPCAFGILPLERAR